MSPQANRNDPAVLAAAVRRGEVRAIARLITLVERSDPAADEALAALQPDLGHAHIVGITGPPGCGKSTLVDQLITHARNAGLQVGVISIDPTSPFTGGAILADRLRMQRHSVDPNIFIRSMASRGEMGGLSAATWDAAHILDASGRDVIFIETVGAGQLETDIVAGAHTIVVVTVPGLGDSVQAIKAGLMEIGDIFVVNMADRPGADRAVADLRMLLEMSVEQLAWEVPVLTTVATEDQGVATLWEHIQGHWTHLHESGALAGRLQEQVRAELLRGLDRYWQRHRLQWLNGNEEVDQLVAAVTAGEIDLHTAITRLWQASQQTDQGEN